MSYLTMDDSENCDPIFTFGVASFLNDASSDMIAPIWPSFLKFYVGLNILQIGIVDGLAQAIVAMSKVGAGWASDKTGKRKSFITGGYFLSMVGRLGFVLSLGFVQILLWKSLDRLGKIRGPPRDAIVASYTDEKKRGRTFGVLRAMDTAGAVVGSLITLLLFSILGYVGIILLAAIPAGGSVLVILVFIKEKKGKDVFRGINFRGLNRDLKIFLVASILFATATFSYSFLMLFSLDYGYVEIQLPMLYILFTLIHALSSYPFGRASDRWGRKPILILAFALLIMTAGMTPYVTDFLSILPLFALFGLVHGALEPVQTSFVADLVEKDRMASILGFFQMCIGFSALIGGTLIGYLWLTFGPIFAFQFAMYLAIIALVILLLIRPRDIPD